MNYQNVTKEQIVNDPKFKKVNVVKDVQALRESIAMDLAAKIKANNAQNKNTTAILPVSPLDYTILAKICNEQNICLKNFCILNMDDLLDDNNKRISATNSLSFTDYMERNFYRLIKPELGMSRENGLIPDPDDTGAIQRKIDERGGVDVCYAGFGISGHVAFNEPCKAEELPKGIEYVELPTRIIRLCEASRAQIALSSGGDLKSVQTCAITIGMKELMQAKEMHIIGLRTWHPAVFRRAMYSEITPEYPSTYLQRHPNLYATITEHVAQPPVLLPE